MNTVPVDELLASLSATSPCGEDLEYDPAFVALETASRGKPEQQFGDKLIAAEAPDWRAVNEQALDLAQRTRDLRVAVLLARSAAHVHGLRAYAEGLALVAGLLDQHWPHVHPMLDASDGDDPTMRMNALDPLAHTEGGLADLRSAAVGQGRQALTVRQIELAFSTPGKLDPRPGESVPSQDAVLAALRGFEAADPGWLGALRQVGTEVARIEAALTGHLGSAVGPDMTALRTLTRCLAHAAIQARGGTEAGGTEESMDGRNAGHTAERDATRAGPFSGLGGSGGLSSREDVLRTLDRVCDWLERNEPTNPAPLLIRRAQRLMKKNFMDIIRDLAPDGFDQVEKIAGVETE